jgi:hypothetical protein
MKACNDGGVQAFARGWIAHESALRLAAIRFGIRPGADGLFLGERCAMSWQRTQQRMSKQGARV